MTSVFIMGVPPARKKGNPLCGHRPFSCRLSGYTRYFGSKLLSLTRKREVKNNFSKKLAFKLIIK
jgi:hypothetical protein